jgi:hypothetical protein
MSSRTPASSLLENREANVALFAFLLNFPWEFWQVPFHEEIPDARHWDAVLACTQATFGDALIAVVAFWIVAAGARSRDWIMNPTARSVTGFVAVGVAITVILEWISTRLLDRWSYSELMPTIPLLGTGLVPVLQWILLPPLIVWFVRRQLS